MSTISQLIVAVRADWAQYQQDRARQAQIQQEARNNNGIQQEPTPLITRIENLVFSILSNGIKTAAVLALIAANIALPIIPLFLAHAAAITILSYAIFSLLVLGADLVAAHHLLSTYELVNRH